MNQSDESGSSPDREILVAECFAVASDLPLEDRRAFVQQFFGEDSEATEKVLDLLLVQRREELSLWQKLGPVIDIESRALDEGSTATVKSADTPNAQRDAFDDADSPSALPTIHQLPRIPGHRLDAVIGHGGMGIVVEAFDEGFQVDVAIKLMRAYSLPETLNGRKRFLHEARAVAKLRHPNIVGVLREGETEDGVLWFSMERVRGQSLEKIVPREGMEINAAVRITRQVCEALAYAHRSNILHRDIKPGNVLLNEEDQAKVVDFGLAKNIGSDAAITQAGHVVGTLQYMAPEQIDHEIADVTPASDIYALGGLLYFLLVGRPPLNHAKQIDQWRAVLYAQPPSPSSIRSDVPKDLSSICLKCLEKRPVSRYATARDLIEDIERFSLGMPVLARPIGPLRRTCRWTKRNPLAVAIFATLIAGIAASGYFARRAIKGEWVADQRAETLEAQGLELEEKAAALEISSESLRQQLYGANFRNSVSLVDRGKFDDGYQALMQLIPDQGEVDRRGIEWYMMWQKCHSSFRLANVSSYTIKSIAVSPDNEHLACATSGGLQVWNYRTGKLEKVIRRGLGVARFNFDGTRLVTIDDESSSLVAWSTESWKVVARVRVDLNRFRQFDAGNSSNLVAIIRLLEGQLLQKGAKSNLTVVDLDSGEIVCEATDLPMYARGVRFSPNDKHVAIGGANGPAFLVTLETKSKAELKPGWMFSFSPQCDVVVYSAGAWDVATAKQISKIGKSGDATDFYTERAIRIQPNGELLASSGFDGKVYLYSTETWSLVDIVDSNLTSVWEAVWSPAGDRLIVAGATGEAGSAPGSSKGSRGLRVLDAKDGYRDVTNIDLLNDKKLNSLKDRYSTCVDATVNGETIFAGTEDGSIVRFRSSAKSEQITASDSMVRQVVAMGPSRTAFRCESGDAGFVNWTNGTTQNLATSNPVDVIAKSAASADQIYVATGSLITRYNLPDLEPSDPIDCGIDVSNLSIDENSIVVGAESGVLVLNLKGNKLWESSIDGRLSHVTWPNGNYVKHPSPIAVADRNTVFAGGPDGKIYRFSAGTRPQLLAQVTFPITKLATSDNGRRLVAFGANNEYYILDVETGLGLLQQQYEGRVFDAAVDPRGDWIIDCIGIADYGNWPRIHQFVKPRQGEIAMQLIRDAEIDPDNAIAATSLKRQLTFMGADHQQVAKAKLAADLLKRAVDRAASSAPVLDTVKDHNTSRPNTGLHAEAKQSLSDVNEALIHLSGDLLKSERDPAQVGLHAIWSSPREGLNIGAMPESLQQTTGFASGLPQQERLRHALEVIPAGKVYKLHNQGLRWFSKLDEQSIFAFYRNAVQKFDLLTGQLTTMAEVPDRVCSVLPDLDRACVYVGTGGRWDSKLNKFVHERPATLLRFDFDTWDKEVLHQYEAGRIKDLNLSTDGRFLLATGEGTNGIRFDTTTKQIRELQSVLPDAVAAMHSRQGHAFVLTSSRLDVIDLLSDDITRHRPQKIPGAPRKPVVLRGGKLLGVCYAPNTIAIIDLATGNSVSRVDIEIPYDPALVTGPHGDSVLAGTSTGQVVQIFTDPKKQPRKFTIGSGTVRGIVLMQRHHSIICSADNGIFLLKLADDKENLDSETPFTDSQDTTED